jgi:hypothetical protein
MPLQEVWPARQPHVPLLHGMPGGQTWPHAPQFFESVPVSLQPLLHSSWPSHRSAQPEQTCVTSSHFPVMQSWLQPVGELKSPSHEKHVRVHAAGVSRAAAAPEAAAPPDAQTPW